ncbi:hypothetical protein [Paraburkholderia kururiensis]|uniref:hypothetical protein n=1 Tax=Paraburkholderia kururiensis TaxID=984307 RepID=UPI000AD058BF|nr:hypothetical protein [Paraburkholderia kururiensis]
MDILELARKAGMQVLLDAQIGQQSYHSVCGSLTALQRFADAVCAAKTEQATVQSNGAVATSQSSAATADSTDAAPPHPMR